MYSGLLCHRLVGHNGVDLFLGCPSCPLVCVSVFVPVFHTVVFFLTVVFCFCFSIAFFTYFGCYLGLHCCVGFCVAVASRGHSLVVEQGLLLWIMGSRTHGLQQLLREAQWLQTEGSRALAQ